MSGTMSRKEKLTKKQDQVKETAVVVSKVAPLVGEIIGALLQISKIWEEDETD